MLSHFHLIPERNGQTDGRTDKIAISILRVSVLTLDNNVSQWAVVHYKQKYVAFLSIFAISYMTNTRSLMRGSATRG